MAQEPNGTTTGPPPTPGSSLGVCSWSLQAASPGDLATKLQACGLASVQLALEPIRRGDWDEAETVSRLDEAGIRIVSGMMETAGEDYSTLESIRATGGVRPDATWPENLARSQDNAALAARLGIGLVTLHAGFIPHNHRPHNHRDPEWDKLIGRLRELIDVFAAQGVRVGLETGQESGPALIEALEAIDRPTLGVNFDPANMILYGMGDPVRAIADLAPHVVQIHIKDAVRTKTTGTWGSEVPAGTGDVDWAAFFGVVGERLPGCNLIIEREAGDERIRDVARAADLVRALAPWIGRP